MFVSDSHASILHADLDAFYASVEQRDDPSLRGRPVVVGGGVVLAASYEAKAYGVRTASSGAHALRLCPQAVVVRPRMAAYAEASRAVFDIFRRTTPLVEGISIDEAFLDVGGLARVSGTPEAVARRLRADVATEVGLPITVGIARTKFLAKVASAVAKPDGLLVVDPERELDFLHPLPVERLWGVGAVTSGKLRGLGVRTVGELAHVPEDRLAFTLGRAAARHLHALAWARDPRRVDTGRSRRSIGAQHALGRHRRTLDELDADLAQLVERTAARLRRSGRRCRTVVLRVRFGDYTRATRSHTLAHSTTDTDELLATARTLLRDVHPRAVVDGLTLIGVSLTGLDQRVEQLELPFDETPARHLDRTLDDVRSRFGAAAVTRGTLVGRGPLLSVPILPD
ncbi:DNA polymerase IV [Rhodococcus sp. HNM0569]|uniref:DNA polymerase IV n=1 Tax=Rhodococcus sp. HNM0569 TaxID=2716340 RepID=UPI00146CA8CC|nr:DNA polymerase IV [Rhodococcus sp. HNM0569]NLU84001.1 DNA polymerase IV [Rhodococcus sp. HNM0569]